MEAWYFQGMITVPGIDPLSFPDALFQGDQVVTNLKGRHLSQVTGVRVRPAKGITCQLGDATEQQEVQRTPDTLTVTVTVDRATPPGEKYLTVHAPNGDSNPILFIVMM